MEVISSEFLYLCHALVFPLDGFLYFEVSSSKKIGLILQVATIIRLSGRRCYDSKRDSNV